MLCLCKSMQQFIKIYKYLLIFSVYAGNYFAVPKEKTKISNIFNLHYNFIQCYFDILKIILS